MASRSETHSQVTKSPRRDGPSARSIITAAASVRRAEKKVSVDPESQPHEENDKDFDDIESDPAWMAVWIPEHF
ncbi:hypothetical protein FGB62_427g00 [Gracilaria domingensis]|nr:hypothetical protein FGB62_427g00 [Gracilaria domingensis]